MGLIGKLFGRGNPPSRNASLAFRESETPTGQARSGNEPRRELVKMVLRDTLRQHGIPANWIDCRTLSVKTRQHKSGLHVQLLVRQGDQELLPFVHAFQESLQAQVRKFDAAADDWLFSISWQFFGKPARSFASMPRAWSEPAPAAALHVDIPLPSDDVSDELASDLQALQAVITQPAPLPSAPRARH